MKVHNDDVWNNYVKTGKVKGFSIEGYFADKLEKPQDKSIKDELSKIEEEEAQHILDQLTNLFDNEQEFESYADYPDGVKNNAKARYRTK